MPNNNDVDSVKATAELLEFLATKASAKLDDESIYSTLDRLLKSGADVNGRDVSHNTPLHFACATGNFTSIPVLLGIGANANLENDNGKTPLFCINFNEYEKDDDLKNLYNITSMLLMSLEIDNFKEQVEKFVKPNIFATNIQNLTDSGMTKFYFSQFARNQLNISTEENITTSMYNCLQQNILYSHIKSDTPYSVMNYIFSTGEINDKHLADAINYSLYHRKFKLIEDVLREFSNANLLNASELRINLSDIIQKLASPHQNVTDKNENNRECNKVLKIIDSYNIKVPPTELNYTLLKAIYRQYPTHIIPALEKLGANRNGVIKYEEKKHTPINQIIFDNGINITEKIQLINHLVLNGVNINNYSREESEPYPPIFNAIANGCNLRLITSMLNHNPDLDFRIDGMFTLADVIAQFYASEQPDGQHILRQLMDTLQAKKPEWADDFTAIREGRYQLPMPLDEVHNEFNDAQSTHLQSVHASVSSSAARLQSALVTKLQKINPQQSEAQIISVSMVAELIKARNSARAWVDNATPKDTEKSWQVIHAARRAVKRLRHDTYTDRDSQISTKDALGLVWISCVEHDNRNGDDNAKIRFIQHLYESQRGYNIKGNGSDDMRARDMVICAAGSFNKVIDTLNGIDPLVEIIVVKKEQVLQKVIPVINDIFNEIKDEQKKSTLAKQWVAEGGVPDNYLEELKQELASRLRDEFDGLLAGFEETLSNILFTLEDTVATKNIHDYATKSATLPDNTRRTQVHQFEHGTDNKENVINIDSKRNDKHTKTRPHSK